jgi:hypothetical protein
MLFFSSTRRCVSASLLANNPDFFFNIVIVGRVTEELDEEKLWRSLTCFCNYSLTFRRFAPPADMLLPLTPGAHYTIDTYTWIWLAEFFRRPSIACSTWTPTSSWWVASLRY